MDIIKYDQVMVIDDLFTSEEVEMMDTYFTYFDGWQLIFDDSPDDNLQPSLWGEQSTTPTMGSLIISVKTMHFNALGFPFLHFIRVVYNAFRFGDSPSIHCDGESRRN